MSKIASIFELESSAKSAISDFFRATERLKELDIFRSDQYLGDLGEYLARLCFSIEPVESCREEGHDGKDGEGRKVQVKFHNSKKGTI